MPIQSKIVIREDAALTALFIVVVLAQIFLWRFSVTQPSLFVVYATLAMLMKFSWHRLALLQFLLFFLLPFTGNIYLYGIVFAISFLVTFFVVRMYFDLGSYWAAGAVAVLLTVLSGGLYAFAVRFIAHTAVEAEFFLNMAREVALNSVVVLAIFFFFKKVKAAQ